MTTEKSSITNETHIRSLIEARVENATATRQTRTEHKHLNVCIGKGEGEK